MIPPIDFIIFQKFYSATFGIALALIISVVFPYAIYYHSTVILSYVISRITGIKPKEPEKVQ